MDVKHGNAAFPGFRTPSVIVQRKHLHTRATKSLDAMTGTAHQQKRSRVRRAVQHHIHGEHFAVTPKLGMCMAVDFQVGGLRSIQKFTARLGVSAGESVSCGDHAACGASQASARLTQKVAPSGIRSSLKS